MLKLVSILMPAYNVSTYIIKAIEGCLNQTYSHFELLIGNDGSTDNTMYKISKYKDPRIKVFNYKNNIGNQIMTNVLLESAYGDYIAIHDADDWSDPLRLEKQIFFLEANSNIGIVGSDIHQISMEKYQFPHRYHEFNFNKLNKNLTCYSELPITWATVMFRRSVYEKVGGFREYFNRLGGGDVDWIYRASFTTNMYILNEKLYYVRRHFDSFTKSFNPDPRKLISSKIAFHLYQQRYKTGTDDLDSQPERLEQWINYELREYYSDKSKIFYEYADSELHRKRALKAVKPSLLAFINSPFRVRNLKQMIFIFLSLLFPNLMLGKE